MKIKHFIAVMSLSTFCTTASLSEPVYLVHGDDSSSAARSDNRPVDLYVDGLCIDGVTSDIPVNRMVGPLDLPSGTYAVEVRLSTSPVCDDGPIAVSGDIKVDPYEKFILAYLSSSDVFTLNELGYPAN